MKNIFLALLLVLALQTNSRSFFYSPKLQKTAFYQCYKSTAGTDRIGLNLIQVSDQIRPDDVQNMQNALSAGLKIDAVIAPYRCRPLDQEMEFIKANIKFGVIERFWVDLASYSSACDWASYSPEQNCQFLVELMARLKSLGLELGIANVRNTWIYNFKNVTACPQVSTFPLWWGPYQQEDDGQPNFNSYHQIGGWKTPYMKLYKPTQLCGVTLYESYYV